MDVFCHFCFEFVHLGGRFECQVRAHRSILELVVVGWYVFIAFRIETLFRTTRSAIVCTKSFTLPLLHDLHFLLLHFVFLKGVICCYMQRTARSSANTKEITPFSCHPCNPSSTQLNYDAGFSYNKQSRCSFIESTNAIRRLKRGQRREENSRVFLLIKRTVVCVHSPTNTSSLVCMDPPPLLVFFIM